MNPNLEKRIKALEDKQKDWEKRTKALEDNQIKTIMTKSADMNVYRSVQRALISNNLSLGSSNEPTPNSVILVLNSNNKAFIPPRMTDAQRNAILNPVEGMLIYNITVHNLQDYNGSSWNNV